MCLKLREKQYANYWDHVVSITLFGGFWHDPYGTADFHRYVPVQKPKYDPNMRSHITGGSGSLYLMVQLQLWVKSTFYVVATFLLIETNIEPIIPWTMAIPYSSTILTSYWQLENFDKGCANRGHSDIFERCAVLCCSLITTSGCHFLTNVRCRASVENQYGRLERATKDD